MSDSPYTVLNVPATASSDEIRAAYRALVKRHHPDAPSGSADLFRAIQAAYDVLADAEKRQRYDAVRQLLDDSEQVPISDPWGWAQSPSGVFQFSGMMHSASAVFYSPFAGVGASSVGVSFSPPTRPQSGSSFATHVIHQNVMNATMRVRQAFTQQALVASKVNLLAPYQVGNTYYQNGQPIGVITSVKLYSPFPDLVEVECDVNLSAPIP